MLTQPEPDSDELSASLILWTSLIAAGAFIVVSKTVIATTQDPLSVLINFLSAIAIAAVFVYKHTKKHRVTQMVLTAILIPPFVILLMLLAAFASELFYGGSGYHGEYLFPFLENTKP